MKLNRFFLWVTLALFFVVVAVSLNSPLIDNAAKYAQISREILENHEWINLTIAGDAYDQKPPLLFWIGAVFFHFFGISTLVWKMTFLLVSILGIYSTYKLGKLFDGESTGRLAALFWTVNLGYLFYHSDIHTDTLLADLVVFSIWQFAVFFKEKKSYQFFLGVTGTGLSMLAKGPVGLVVPACSVAIHLLLNRQWKDVFHLRWILAFFIISAIIAPALLGLFNQFGLEGIKFYFWTNNMGRITGSYYGHNTDPFFYLHSTLYVIAPFTIFAIFGLVYVIGRLIPGKGKSGEIGELYTLGGIIPYLLILSVAKTKNPHYLMAVGPLFMVIAARFAAALSDGGISKSVQKTVYGLNIFVLSLIWIIIGLFVFWLFPEKNVVYWLMISVFAGLLFWFTLHYHGLLKQIAMLTITILAFMFSLNISFYPKMQKYHSPLIAVKEYNQKAFPGERIHLYKPASRYWDILFYAKSPGKYYISKDELPQLICESKDWVFTDMEGRNEIINLLPHTKIIGEYDHQSLSKITLPFLNPGTRASKLKKRYLLHLP
jgi:4-amino-4-deoxy-L-arabinose transferase-like glycosyltransferase